MLDSGIDYYRRHFRLRTNGENRIYPAFGMDKILLRRIPQFNLSVQPKNLLYLVIWPENDAKEKENVGILSLK